MKKMFIALLFVVSTIMSASAYTVVVDLPCGMRIMTDSSSGNNRAEWDEFVRVMAEYYC